MGIYPIMRWVGTFLLLCYVILRAFSQPTIWSELALFNSVALATIPAIMVSKVPDDRRAKVATSLAITTWTFASILSSIDSFYETNFEIVAQIGYLLFYPLIFFGLVRALSSESRTLKIEFIDTLILALSASTMAALFLIRPISQILDGTSLDIFLAIIYPVADLVLFFSVTASVFRSGLSRRNFAILVGVGVYSCGDLYFLWRNSTDTYVFGSLMDSLWLLSFVLLSWGLSFPADEESRVERFNPAIAGVALLASATVIAISVIQPNYFPRFAILPAVATISMAFARMVFALNEAKRLGEERALARTDELTGLANRRRFISAFEDFKSQPGSLLILDLDGFKAINDHLGHEIGDELLRQAARRFERVLPREALLARLGGDEFGVLVPGDEGPEVALALRATLSYPFLLFGERINLGVSIGEADHDPSTPTSDSLLRRADEAMYHAKRTGAGVSSWSETIMTPGF